MLPFVHAMLARAPSENDDATLSESAPTLFCFSYDRFVVLIPLSAEVPPFLFARRVFANVAETVISPRLTFSGTLTPIGPR